MASSIIGDAKFQELSMSFTFDEQYEDKLIIDILAQNIPYQIELLSNPYLEFQDLKQMLISRQFKLISKSSEILKIKVGATALEFKNVQKLTLESLKQRITQLSNKLKDQCTENNQLKERIQKIKTNMDMMTERMIQLVDKNNETRDDMAKVKRQLQDNLIKQQQQIKNHQKRLLSQQQRITIQQVTIQQQKLIITQLQTELLQIHSKYDNISQEQTTINKKLESKIQIKQQNQLQIPPYSAYSNYQFSSKHLSNKISIINNIRAINSNQNWQNDQLELVLVEGPVLKKGSLIKLRIDSIDKCVSVGFGIRNLIAENSYQLKNFGKVGHGCFLFMWNGRLYSHSNENDNNMIIGIKYDSGDVLKIVTNENELLLINESKKKDFKTKISLTQNEWKEACFCVSLRGQGDSVSIL